MSGINDSCFTYPEPESATFTKAERARWNKNLESLMKRLGLTPKKPQPQAKKVHDTPEES